MSLDTNLQGETKIFYIIDKKDYIVIRSIDEGIHRANKKAISRAATVQKWTIVPRQYIDQSEAFIPSL